MSVAKSLHIGLNAVDPKKYGGWDGKLNACEADANDMDAIAAACGFKTKKMLTTAATRDAVLKELVATAGEIKSGDIFLLSYSGHGGQVPDKNNDEDDNVDETWCLYDGELIDDELFAVWSKFPADARILVFSDSCHSGTVVRLSPSSPGQRAAPAEQGTWAARAMPKEVVGRAYRAQKELYDRIQSEKPRTEGDVSANVLLISGCQDSQTSADGPFNGAFTGALLRIWNEGTFKGTYRTFHEKIQRQLPLTQQPNLMTLGNGKTFVTQRPFTI